jgi:hypothetical protein
MAGSTLLFDTDAQKKQVAVLENQVAALTADNGRLKERVHFLEEKHGELSDDDVFFGPAAYAKAMEQLTQHEPLYGERKQAEWASTSPNRQWAIRLTKYFHKFVDSYSGSTDDTYTKYYYELFHVPSGVLCHASVLATDFFQHEWGGSSTTHCGAELQLTKNNEVLALDYGTSEWRTAEQKPISRSTSHVLHTSFEREQLSTRLMSCPAVVAMPQPIVQLVMQFYLSEALLKAKAAYEWAAVFAPSKAGLMAAHMKVIRS